MKVAFKITNIQSTTNGWIMSASTVVKEGEKPINLTLHNISKEQAISKEVGDTINIDL